MMRSLLVVVAACGAAGTPISAPPGDEITIVDVAVVTGDRSSALTHQTVIVRGDKIATLGPTASVTPRGRTIDGRGKWLIPGLADMHVHTYDPLQLQLFVALGVTTIRVMWGEPGTIGVRNAIARGEPRLAPTIITAGPIVDGDPPVWPGSRALTTVQQAIDEVAAEHAAGYDFVKVYAKLPVDLYAAIVREAGHRGLPVMGHVPSAVGLVGALDVKQRTIEHLDGYASAAQLATVDSGDFKARMRLFKTADSAKLSELIARTKAAGTWNCPTLVVLDRIAHLDATRSAAAAIAAHPELKYVSPEAMARWSPAKDFRFQSWGPDDFQAARDDFAWRLTVVKQLADAGAGIIAGTDVGNPWLVPGYSLHQELEQLVAAKLTPHQALRAATAGPAELFGGSWGTIKPGGRADLVLLDGDPLVDIRNTQRIAGVMLRGRWLDAGTLERLKSEVSAVYAGTRSRFAEVPLPNLPGGHSPVWSARFTSREGNGGEQRVVVGTRADAWWISGEQRADNTLPDQWEIEAGRDGTGHKLHVRSDGLDLVGERIAGNLHIAARIGGTTKTLTEPIGDDELIGGAPLAADLLFYRQLRPLAIDTTATIKIAAIDARLIAIQHLAFTVTRRRDDIRTIGGNQQAVRVFEVKLGWTKFEVALDSDGWPVETPEFVRAD